MSLHKAIEHGKEKRKPYRGAAAIDTSCRNGGDCPHCRDNRRHKIRKAEEAAKYHMRIEYELTT